MIALCYQCLQWIPHHFTAMHDLEFRLKLLPTPIIGFTRNKVYSSVATTPNRSLISLPRAASTSQQNCSDCASLASRPLGGNRSGMRLRRLHHLANGQKNLELNVGQPERHGCFIYKSLPSPITPSSKQCPWRALFVTVTDNPPLQRPIRPRPHFLSLNIRRWRLQLRQL